MALAGSIVTLSLFLLGVSFKMGDHSSRLRALEDWRVNMRKDMHEISDKLTDISNDMSAIKAILERRKGPRD